MLTKSLIYTFFLSLIVVIGFIVYEMFFFFEGNTPEIKITNLPESIGEKYNFSCAVNEKETGLKKISIKIRQHEKDFPLFEKAYQRKSWRKGSDIYDENINIPLSIKEAGLKDGNATLLIKAWDFAWKNNGNGNLNEINQKISIDLMPPRISPNSKPLYLWQAGSGLISFEVSEPIKSGSVKSGDSLFALYPNPQKGKNNYISLFALPIGEPVPQEIFIEVEDKAGNKTTIPHRVFIKRRNFQKDIINLSENLLNTLSSKLYIKHPELKGSTPLEIFQKINSELRPQNDNALLTLSKNSSKEILWQDKFILLPNSSYKALFGDQRTYIYGKDKVDYTLHLGIDLASNQNAPVPAANNGIVVFTGYLGIYGETVVLDHGMGLFSSYSHLSSIKVNKGDRLKKGDILGNTGTTGLAVGDHLHFAMMLNGHFVTPMEWIDEKWIKDHITTQM